MSAPKLPPYGKRWLLAPPSAGLCVATGPRAWAYAQCKPFPMLVLPTENEPADFRWPSHPGGAVVFEVGEFNNQRLEALAIALLAAHSPFVVAIREATVETDPRVFFYEEAASVSG